YDTLLLCLLAAFILCIGILIFVLPKESFSEDENRMLADLPKFSVSSLVDGSFTAGVADFYADRLPARRFFVRLKTASELAMLRGESSGIIFGSEGYLVDRLEYGETEYENIRENFEAIEEFRRVTGIEVTTAVLPRGIDVVSEKLFPTFGFARANAVWDKLPDDAITFNELLKGKADLGEYVWYKTDHHYTTLGAYYVYCSLGETLGYTPYPLEYFELQTAADDFLGTTYSAAGIPAQAYDTITLFRYDGDDSYTVSFGKSSLNGFYDESYLSKKDKYSVFLGGNHSLTSVTLDGVERPKLLVIKDSFSHALAPFLALHFDLEMVDLRYYNSSVKKLCGENGIDKVLIYCGIDSLVGAPDMSKLAMGLYS
ncbi:MAG: hypothetical protein IJ011_05870, partial [Clostridia bacterium]|nr:hypothetical protein [Clostridia bacterium]